MRLRMLARPTGTLDGVCLDVLSVGFVYEIRAQVACLLLAEGWAEFVTDDDASLIVRSPPAALAAIKPVVLVVDDDPEVRRLTEALLTAHGYRVALARHGKEAIDLLREQCPDLIVLDLNMPIMDGSQFRHEQRYLTDRKLAAIPVVLMTGADDAAIQATSLQAVAVIKKPVDPDDLMDAVSWTMGSQVSAPDGIRSTRPWRRATQPSKRE